MAQHIPVKDEKIFRSVSRIAPKVFNDIKRNLKMDWAYWNKNIKHLPEDFNPNGHAFIIYPYNMKKVWVDEPNAEDNAHLEVHLSDTGEIQEIYYPL